MPSGPPVRDIVPPAHGELLEAVASGTGLTTTSVLAVAVQPLLLVTVKVYIPDISIVASGMVKLCKMLMGPFGPLHA
jgi:hypothetical protein